MNKTRFSIELAGDSGDGIQLIGHQLTFVCAEQGWQVQTMPDFPAEIRAPQGTLAGVSGYKLSTSVEPLYVSEDHVDIIVALNPAALKACHHRLKAGGVILYNEDQFQKKDYQKAGLSCQSIVELIGDEVNAIPVAIAKNTLAALAESPLSHSDKKKAKNFYALGVLHWLIQVPVEATIDFLNQKFSKLPEIRDANITTLRAGYNFAITLEMPHLTFQEVSLSSSNKEQIISGIKAVSLALTYLTAKTKLSMLVAGYPITPASNILHEAAKLAQHNIKLFQAEDEIAAACAALGASFAGALAMTCTSGPGLDLKAETLGLAVMSELPLVVIDVQRAGPSTGLPTKTEQSDLMMAVYGRHGEAPLPVIAAKSPADAFQTVIDAFKVAINHMTPVIVLLDAQIANGAERWAAPDFSELSFPEVIQNPPEQAPFSRDDRGVRPWLIPGESSAIHRLGGLEKGDEQGQVSYDEQAHQAMVDIRQQKLEHVQLEQPYVYSKASSDDLLIVSWGSTYGSVRCAIEHFEQQDIAIAHLHLRQLYPMPHALKEILSSYTKVLVAELNQGQLLKLIRSELLIDAKGINQVNGQPFKKQTLISQIGEAL